MKEQTAESRITGPLRAALIKADVPLLVLERETGVKRASIRKFMRGETSLHVDIADRLAAFLGLRLTADPKRRK